MKLNKKKSIIVRMFNVGKKRVWLDPNKLSEIKDALTRTDIKSLIEKGIIKIKRKKGVSKGRVRKIKVQKRKGRRKGHGSRKGKRTARLSKKEAWINKIRAQRKFIRLLKDKEIIDSKIYRDLRKKCKGGFFRSRRHIKLYLESIKK